MRPACKGRRHGCRSDESCDVKTSLANPEPSTLTEADADEQPNRVGHRGHSGRHSIDAVLSLFYGIRGAGDVEPALF